jgi:hypothetical protein
LQLKFYYLILVLCTFFTPLIAQRQELPKARISLNSLEDFKPVSGNWKIVGDVFFDLEKANKGKATPGSGILFNTPSDKNKDDLFTKMEHGDIELELEFMMDKGSNAGVYLQGRYEIQMFDSWGVQNPKSSDCGGIYERWDEGRPEGRKGFEGHAPALNVSKAPGLWQHYKIIFKAPRFNDQGEKIANAVFVQVIHNGITIHENVSVSGPTRAAAFEDEKPLGPIMIQGDHGPVAIRNISYKAYGTEPVRLSNLKLQAYEGKLNSIENLKRLTPVREMVIDVLLHKGSGTDENFGGIITGNIEVPRAGEYVFNLNLDWIPDDNRTDKPNGMGELLIGDNKLIRIDGKIGNATALVNLEAGKHPITLSYFKDYGFWYARSSDITLSVEGPGVPFTILNKPIKAYDPVGAINLLADNKPVILRGFINHQGIKKTHAISVGEPGSVNYSLDLETGNFLQVWRGNFMETTPMWHGRGETQLGIPSGSVTEFSAKPTIAFLTNGTQEWPDESNSYNYIGYELNNLGRPIFKYSLGSAQINAGFAPEDGGRKLVHFLSINLGQEKQEIWCKIAEGDDITRLPNGLYSVNDKQYYIELPSKSKPVLRNSSQNKKELLLPVKAINNVGEVKYNIVW